MRNDHTFAGALPTPEAVEAAMRRARRMRSEAVHAYLKRAVSWVRWPFSTDSVEVTVMTRRATC